MGRLLFWMLLAMAVYAMAKHWSRVEVRRGRNVRPRSELMVGCASCGLNVPQSEAVQRDGRWYCSTEHLERARPAG